MASVSIFGAGSSSTNRVYVKTQCGSERVIIPFIIKVIDDDDQCDSLINYYDIRHDINFTFNCECDSSQKPSKSCGDYETHVESAGTTAYTFTYKGTVYSGLTVYFTLFNDIDCHETPGCKSGCAVGDYWITKEDGELFVNYEQYSFSDCNSITKSIEHKPFTCTSDTITIDTECDSKFTFRYECDDVNPCSASTVVNIRGVTFNPITVDNSGGSVSITASYEKIVTDEDCNERKTRGSIILSGNASSCSTNCCYDNTVPLSAKTSDIISKLKLPEGTPITYNGKEVTGDYIIFNIVQKANQNLDECDKNCEYKTTYCVLEGDEIVVIKGEEQTINHKINVEYETYWGSKVWLSGGTISAAGGRAKISFDYKAFAESTDASKSGTCKSYEFNGSDSVIIEVPPCDPDAEDPQPSYTLPGVILYKERYSGCSATTHVSGETVTIDGEDVLMNHISYEITQDCTGTCIPHEYKEYGKRVVTADICETSITLSGTPEQNPDRYGVPYTSWTVNSDCKRTSSSTIGYESRTVLIDMNQTNSAATYNPDDDITVTQPSGYCIPAEACACSALTIVGAGGEYTDVCDSPVYVYNGGKPIRITCEAHEEVEIPFVGYCDGVAVYNGIYKWKGYFPCNSSSKQITYTRDDNGGTMTVIQEGNCTNCGEIPPSPGGCEGGSQLRYEYATVRLPDCNERLNFKVESEPYSAYCGDDFKSASTSSVTINVSCNDTGSQRTLEYKGVPIIQPGGSCQCQQPSEDCSQGLVEDGTLNSIIDSVVNSGSLLGVHVSKSDTPCTYKYLRDVYANVSAATTDAHSGPNLTELSWVIANAMSELTPYSGIATSYFINAAEHHPGGSGSRRPNPFGNDEKINKIISDRINGAIEYVKYKSGGKQTQSGLTSNARIELHSKNADISATMRSKPANDWGDEPEYVNLVELIQEGVPLDTFRSVDYNITSGIILDYQANTTDTAKKARLEEAIKDKDSRPHYMVHDIFGLDNTDSNKYLAYYACDDFTKEANGCVKWNKKYARWRPEPHHKLASPNVKFTIPTSGVVYVSNETEWYTTERQDYYTFASCCGACGGPGSADCVSADSTTCSNGYDCSKDCEGAQAAGVIDRCPEDGLTSHESYPSGHAMYGFFMYLVYGQALGSRILNDKKERVERYCDNRTIVRAHWMSDVIIAKYNASMQIGFINGFQEYFDVLDTPTFPS